MQVDIRGQLSLHLGEESIVLRPTIATLIELESEMGMSLIEIVEHFGKRKMSVGSVKTVLRAGLKGSTSRKKDGSPFTEEDLDSMILEQGLAQAMKVAVTMMMSVVSGGKGAEEALGKA